MENSNTVTKNFSRGEYLAWLREEELVQSGYSEGEIFYLRDLMVYKLGHYTTSWDHGGQTFHVHVQAAHADALFGLDKRKDG